jgi:hypothetical protein
MKKTHRLTMDVQTVSKLDAAALHKLHRDLFGSDRPMPNAEHLRRKIVWHVQAQAEGALPEAARQRALAIARNSKLRVRNGWNGSRGQTASPAQHAVTTGISPTHDSRLPMPGSLLVKDFKGQTIVVKVLDDGFEYDGRRFASLSAVAKEITGTKWNGFLFFGLTKEDPHGR